MPKLNRHLNVKVNEQIFDQLAELRGKLNLPLSEIARRAIIIGAKRLDHAKLPGGPVPQQLDLPNIEKGGSRERKSR
jgi:hypothetical protein